MDYTVDDLNPAVPLYICITYVPGNVLKEICEPTGGRIQASAFQMGDPTLSILELWGAEYQESNALLVRPEARIELQKIANREKCPVSFVGVITGDRKVRIQHAAAK